MKKWPGSKKQWTEVVPVTPDFWPIQRKKLLFLIVTDIHKKPAGCSLEQLAIGDIFHSCVIFICLSAPLMFMRNIVKVKRSPVFSCILLWQHILYTTLSLHNAIKSKPFLYLSYSTPVMFSFHFCLWTFGFLGLFKFTWDSKHWFSFFYNRFTSKVIFFNE